MNKANFHVRSYPIFFLSFSAQFGFISFIFSDVKCATRRPERRTRLRHYLLILSVSCRECLQETDDAVVKLLLIHFDLILDCLAACSEQFSRPSCYASKG
jgi:hypothetical protein